ncbi:flagellar biosynthesis protein FlhF [Alkalihalobacillus oceani]|uniref:Flagellar biosynthesis protein FlhF n=1 Tax=Halalkalibacter oceani TaxID=1653776 RepID=A0A9X2INA3_9BACI|nr:flagellar biosynthesis protein FlhF [Halalkalibacter oceani]MCM3713212.1 flagellar biosynthesis protein FlhF [Halalkalibacter oceani]
MKVKKYIAATMPEAMKRIRGELGDEAVILHSKEVKTGGVFGLFAKKQLEVVAAVDPGPTRVRKETLIRPAASPSPSPAARTKPAEQERLLKEMNQLKAMIGELATKEKTIISENHEYPQPFQAIEDQLKKQGVSKPIRLQLLKHVLKEWYEQPEAERPGQDIEKELVRYLEQELADVPFGGFSFSKKMINIVGPTGVGKTTTIAKLAAHLLLKKQKKIALITTDTYRIAAIEQIKTYAKILNIPLEVAYSIDDFSRAVAQFEQYDYILVDSAGRNFRNPLYIEELAKVIDFEQQAETFLVLSLTAKYEDMNEIIRQFSLLEIEKVILTKQDETASLGALLNIPLEHGKGIAYITNGQNVPDDIMEATVPYVIRAVLEVDEHE